MKLAKHITFRLTDVGGILLDGKSGKYWELNPSGALSLSLLLDGEPSDKVCRRICSEYDVHAEEAGSDLQKLERHLRQERLVE
ncbi:lasso peptide biosynthesis PqqD family chaperone [Rhizobium lusitanum]|uniref:Lasso peptide biosynthesis PqqD family chaperone n=1 Tax=Rhizobium lusitanum TaxID=293958 RepID=A0A7X0IXB9_9HYPH|nr:lasso peptide biosynthesis PqqD family chaperone [Rhizobium lusitanum]MBB6488869.1 hypothetical protein [Rhizobium lusitanum]